jgi:NADH-quinone oxidoreductase subunit C
MFSQEEEKILSILRGKYEDQVLLSEKLYDFVTVTLKKDKIIEVIEFLRDNPDTQFKFLTTLCGIHYPDKQEIAMMYQLHNMFTGARIRLKTYLPQDNPVIPTLTNVFPGANWMERETYDFFGVKFEGHPDLRRILNVEEMIIFPLRKEYPLEDQTREDKADEMFGR